MDGKGLAVVMLFAYFVWLIYMATFRTEDYRKMRKDNWDRGTKILGTGWKVGSVLVRGYLSRRR